MNDERRVWEDGRERWMRQREGMMERILMQGYRYIAIATSLTIIWYLESWKKKEVSMGTIYFRWSLLEPLQIFYRHGYCSHSDGAGRT